jgi:hypothetical protein
VVADEVHRPLLTGRSRPRRLHARRGREAPSSTDADGELMLAVEALDALVVVEKPHPAQLAMQEAVAVARLVGGHLEQRLDELGRVYARAFVARGRPTHADDATRPAAR